MDEKRKQNQGPLIRLKLEAVHIINDSYAIIQF